MRRSETMWALADACSRWRLRARGLLRIAFGTVLRDGFMTLAGRFDLSRARRGPVPGSASRRVHGR